MRAFLSTSGMKYLGRGLVFCLAVGIAGTATAGDYYTTVPFLPTVKIGPDSSGATPARDVYGKEYSHTNWSAVYSTGGDPNLTNVDDHDAFGTPDPLQVVSWDGLVGPYGDFAPGSMSGGPNSGSVDAFDFDSPTYSYDFNLNPPPQLDALASRYDFLFRQVVENTASLLFSTTADLDASTMLSTGSVFAKAHVHFEDPDPIDLSPTGDILDVWAGIEAFPAGPGGGPGVNHHVVEDLDALEVWGPEPPSHDALAGVPTTVKEGYIGGFVPGPGPKPNTADGNRFSLDVDSATGTSVFAFFEEGPLAGIIKPWIPHSEIVDAVESLFLSPLGDDLHFDQETRDKIDVDGTMARDLTPELDDTSMGWGPGDELLFTIDPFTAEVRDALGSLVTITVDGGEIMHLVKTSPGLGPGTFVNSFLSHGGHLWDTKFDVSGTFGYEFEDVDALEAVGTLTGDTDIPTPEPSAALLGGIAVLLAGVWRRRD